MDYILTITIGAIFVELPTTWEVGIKQCYAFSEKFNKKWTRHSSCSGCVKHMDTYFDLYNEGSIMLKKKE